jgi:hypothetical protein
VTLTREQVDALLQPIAGARVKKKDGMSHVEAYDVRRRLTNIFGFGGWSEELTDLTMLYEQSRPKGGQPDGEPTWRCSYRATVKLTIHATGAVYEESATGANWGWNNDGKRDEAHDFAIKMAVSQAIKRCAVNLGDQFGASLYNDGSLAPLVVYVLGDDPAQVTTEHDGKAFVVRRPEKGEAGQTADHVTEPLAAENPETPASGGDEAPPVADSPPAQDQPSLAAGDDLPIEDPPQVLLARQVDEIRQWASDEDVTPNAVKARLTKVLMEANKLKVRGEYVPTPDGEARTLEAYIQAAIAEVGK